MEITGKKVAILVEDFFDEREFLYPFYRLKEAGAQVVTVGSGRTEVFRSKLGLEVKADTDPKGISGSHLDGVVIPGGYAPDHMRRHPEMIRLVKDLFESGRVVAAICHAGWMLASAGAVRGRHVTSFFAIKDDLVHAGADWIDREVVVDGNLITSRTPDDLPAFMKAVIQALERGTDR